MRLSEAVQERLDRKASDDARWDARDAEKNRLAAMDRANAEFILAYPAIGMLMRAGRPVYYVVRDGKTVEHADPRGLI